MLEYVAVIVPVYNGAPWLDECFKSIIYQSVLSNSGVKVVVSVYNDASTDESATIINGWKSKFQLTNIDLLVGENLDAPKGVGFARNGAIEVVCKQTEFEADYFCFLDCDDVMMPERIEKQMKLCRECKEAIVGCQFTRNGNATVRFTEWCNKIPADLLETQIYTSHGPTVAMPTWFLHKSRLLKFSEAGKGTPEDLIYFYEHLKNGGRVKRVDKELMFYRYHPTNTTFSITSEAIWSYKLPIFIERVLNKLDHFGIWGAGKLGKQFFRSLPELVRHKVSEFYDVDESKLKHGFVNLPYLPDEKSKWVPIKHVTMVKSPFVICLKLNLLGFEEILGKFDFVEGKDYWICN